MPGPSFAIVNLRDGIRRDVESFLVNNDSFPLLENAYLFRGRIEKRSCTSKLGTGSSRLRWLITTTNGAGDTVLTGLPDSVTTNLPDSIVQFLVDDGAGNTELFTDNGTGNLLASGSGAGIINHGFPATFQITGSIHNANVYYYPGLPVMGLRTLEEAAINDEDLIAFDTKYGYIFNNATEEFEQSNQYNTPAVFIWHGSDSDLFWTTNYFHAFWATNNIPGYHPNQNSDVGGTGDGIRWYDIPTNFWYNFNPAINATPNYLWGGLIVLPYKNRLVVLNTQEGPAGGPAVNFPQRARWSQNGTPFYGSVPTVPAGLVPSVDAWKEDITGRGGFIDAPTAEIIVSAEFIKDTLIVYFERSTWQLVYTGNEFLPFVWQKINTELGTESTFSIVPFDRGVFGVGNYGIISCDSVNVERIDQKIPDLSFQIQNLHNGVKRVTGIRDYNSQLVYWNFPSVSDGNENFVNYDLTFPNQVLVFNYLDASWSVFDDSFTCFGYWQRLSDITWAKLNVNSWQATQSAWNSQVLQAKYPNVIAGNQRGFVFVFTQLSNVGQNAPSLEISKIAANVVTIPDHNLVNGDYILITGCVGYTSPNNQIFQIAQVTPDTFETLPAIGAGTGYKGGGLVTHIPNINITTKEFNPFYQNGAGFRLNYLDIYLDKTSLGEITAQFFINDNPIFLQDAGGNPIVETISTSAEPMPTYSQPSPTANYTTTQNKVWHRVYTNSLGSFVQINFTYSDAQMRNLSIATSDVTIHGLICYISPAGRVSYDV